MKSMTGYGRAASQTERYDITVEVHSVNHRFLEASVRLPRSFGYLEEKIKEQVQQTVSRGKVEVSLSMQPVSSKTTTVELDHDVVQAYLSAIERENVRLQKQAENDTAAKSYCIEPDLTLSTLLGMQPVLAEALTQFVQMRQTEGERLKDDVAFHLTQLEQMTDQVEQLVPQTVQQYYDRLYRKITELLEDRTVEESRLVTEAAVVAEKIAVDEELVRLHSHIAQFRGFLDSAEPVGRKMDFLVQEMNREVNTTGSKSQMLEITKLVVDMKSEIEKIREQIQNIE